MVPITVPYTLIFLHCVLKLLDLCLTSLNYSDLMIIALISCMIFFMNFVQFCKLLKIVSTHYQLGRNIASALYKVILTVR